METRVWSFNTVSWHSLWCWVQYAEQPAGWNGCYADATRMANPAEIDRRAQTQPGKPNSAKNTILTTRWKTFERA